jgi:parallel beta-helix repeat protein
MPARLTASLLPLALLLALPARAAAETLLVPQVHATIQAAVDAAADGDTIQVKGGTYAEAVLISGKTNLVLTGKGKVVIDPPDGQAGLTLQDCSGCTVEKIRVLGGQPSGFQLDGCSGGMLLKCRTEASSGDGIRLDDCDGVTIFQCTVKSAGADGISLSGGAATTTDDCSVRENKVFAAGGDAVVVNGTSNTVNFNLAHKPLGRGFVVDDTTPGTMDYFVSNTVVKPGLDGVVLTGSANACSGNKVTGSGGHGVSVSGDAHNIIGNKFVKPALDGLYFAPGSSTCFVNGNTITKPGDDGIDVEGDDLDMPYNDVKSPGDNGWEMQGTLHRIEFSTVSAAGRNGFELHGTGGYCIGSTATGSKDDGFELGVGSSGITLNSDKAKGSKGFDLNDLSGGANTIEDTNDFKTKFP